MVCLKAKDAERKLLESEERNLKSVEDKMKQCSEDLSKTTEKIKEIQSKQGQDMDIAIEAFSNQTDGVKELIDAQDKAFADTNYQFAKCNAALQFDTKSLVKLANKMKKHVEDSEGIDTESIESFKKMIDDIQEQMNSVNTTSMSNEISKIDKLISDSEANQPDKKQLLTELNKMRDELVEAEKNRKNRMESTSKEFKTVTDEMREDGKAFQKETSERLNELLHSVEENMNSLESGNESVAVKNEKETLTKKVTIECPDAVLHTLDNTERIWSDLSDTQSKTIQELTSQLAECQRQLSVLQSTQNSVGDKVSDRLNSVTSNMSTESQDSSSVVMEHVNEMKTSWTGGVF